MSERSVRHRSRERNRSSRKSRDWSRSRSWRSKDSTPGRGTRQRRSSACRKGRNLNVLRRTVSEPVLSQAGLHWEDEDLEINGKAKKKDKCLMRPHTLMDIFDRSYTSPSLPPRTPLFQKTEKPFAECDRFLVSVTVEGSTGPIKLIVKKADTVSDLIKLTIQNYAKEGRHPVLDSDANMFELHLSNFSMESLNRSDRLGELGSRTFFLRQENSGESEPALFTPTPGPFFTSFIVRRMKKISRKTRKFWKIVDCMVCN